jgi:Pyruvate/2-oxoacid:ferredoxin oxidoreductase delta subunit
MHSCISQVILEDSSIMYCMYCILFCASNAFAKAQSPKPQALAHRNTHSSHLVCAHVVQCVILRQAELLCSCESAVEPSELCVWRSVM